MPFQSDEIPAGEASRHVPEGIRIFPNVWPGERLPVQPGDVTQFVPMGFCMGGPIVMRPWDTLESAVNAAGYYGARAHGFHPLHGAPVTEPSGGVLYFDSGSDPETVMGAIQLMHAHTLAKDYAVFVSQASDPQTEGYLVHCRIIPFGSIGHFFRASLSLIEGQSTPQPLTLGEFIKGFITLHEQRYGTGMSRALYGAMGGDGDWAKESLCFGFMMENEYHNICRIWSCAWLVTK